MKKILALIPLVAACTAAQAILTVDAKFTGVELGVSGTVKLNGNSKSVAVGKLGFDWKYTSLTGHVTTVCADLEHMLNGTYHPYDISFTPTDNSGIARAGHIVATYFATANTAAKAAGLQLAVWEALYDNGSTFDATGGHFKTTDSHFSSALTFAQTYYTASQGHAVWGQTCANGGQSQLTPVPEPATLGVLGVGVIAALRRRRKTRA